MENQLNKVTFKVHDRVVRLSSISKDLDLEAGKIIDTPSDGLLLICWDQQPIETISSEFLILLEEAKLIQKKLIDKQIQLNADFERVKYQVQHKLDMAQQMVEDAYIICKEYGQNFSSVNEEYTKLMTTLLEGKEKE